jgi:FAD/FMN-containing dehydrogenase/Fe-S oxidoreductase
MPNGMLRKTGDEMPATPVPPISTEELRKPIEERAPNWRHPHVDARALEQELRRNVQGEVRFDAGSMAMYAVDASNYRQVPIGVVIPKSKDDVVRTVEVCRRMGAPLLSRGAGTSVAGQCCNYAVVIDWSKYLNRILELNPYEKYCRVEPGAICDDVVNATAPYKLTYAPDPATHSRCVFGGMLGNNSCGAHAQMNGPAVINTEAMEILLYDGTRMNVGWMNDLEMDNLIRQGGRVGDVYRKLRLLRDKYRDLIEKRYVKIPRRVSGYNLDQLIPANDGRFNIARALVGSEGTCVTMLEATVKLIYSHPERVLLLIGDRDFYEAADRVPEILPFQPIALEGIDDVLVQNVLGKGGPHSQYVKLLPQGKGWLMVEFGYDTQEEAAEQARRLMNALSQSPHPPAEMKLFIDKNQREHLWAIRESALGANTFVPGKPLTWEGWEDSAVAPDKIGGYLRDLNKLGTKYDYHSSLYGHLGQGCVHCRWNFGLADADGIKKWRAFMEEATDLVTSYGGSISGEHGDGQSKAEFLHKMFGPELIEAFREFKSIWDPDWKMNPGKVVDPYPFDENLRLGANYQPWDPVTHFKFPADDGSFAHAALRCVGVGKCRRMSTGQEGNDTMCPSFMVTREEKHTTRGRAHALWEMLHGDLIQNGWRDDNVKETLDLCLSCKGCKSECPVNVDMATYKAEFLSHYWEGRLRPAHAYAFGLIDEWARVASIAPGFVNLFTQLPGLSFLAKKTVGIPSQRQIPAFATESFQSWFRRRAPKNPGGPKVLLWPDTFNNYFFPETSKAAVEVLESAGYQVEVPRGHVCCGRPLYDYGFLDRAVRYLEHDLQVLRPQIEAGTPVVVLEPSCCSVFRDELNGLMPGRADADKLRQSTFTLSEFLAKKGAVLPSLKREAIIQGHCHHKAIMRMDEEKEVMDKMGLQYELLASGCCGMAGSFGFEEEKYGVSVACGERALLPRVRGAGLRTIIMADGFSCKEQIAQQTNRHALHLAEVLQMALKHGPDGAPGMYPEDEVVKPRQQTVKQSMLRAGLVTAGFIGAAIGLALWRRR